MHVAVAPKSATTLLPPGVKRAEAAELVFDRVTKVHRARAAAVRERSGLAGGIAPEAARAALS